MIWNQLLTLHAGGAEALAGEEDCVVVVFRMVWIAFLLHKGPTAHVLKAPGRVPSLDEADWLREENERNFLRDPPSSLVQLFLKETGEHKSKQAWNTLILSESQPGPGTQWCSHL